MKSISKCIELFCVLWTKYQLVNILLWTLKNYNNCSLKVVKGYTIFFFVKDFLKNHQLIARRGKPSYNVVNVLTQIEYTKHTKAI